MPNPVQTIYIHPVAPAKPAWGQRCNGCGVCCLAEPCPLGMVLSARRVGACRVVVWDAGLQRYQCAAISQTVWAVAQALPPWSKPVQKPLAWMLKAMAARWIAAGKGCDSTLEMPAASATIQTSSLPGVHHD